MRTHRLQSSSLCLLLAVVTLTFSSFARNAATFIVTKTGDTNGTCSSGVDCSLRETIKPANDETNNTGADTIVFAPGVTGTIDLNTALPDISSDLNLQGPGASELEVTRAGGATFALFESTGPARPPSRS
jgi:CSLREA domain-containing protein